MPQQRKTTWTTGDEIRFIQYRMRNKPLSSSLEVVRKYIDTRRDDWQEMNRDAVINWCKLQITILEKKINKNI